MAGGAGGRPGRGAQVRVAACTATAAAVGLTVSLVTGACAAEPEQDTIGLVYCTSPSAGGEVERVEFRQGGEVVAGTTLTVGTLFRADVPADRLVEVYVDGEVVGSTGEDAGGSDGVVTGGGYIALVGEGCPGVPDP